MSFQRFLILSAVLLLSATAAQAQRGPSPDCPARPAAASVGAGGQILNTRPAGPPPGFGAGPRNDPYAGMLKVLFLGDISGGAQNAHEISASDAMATLFQAGKKQKIMMWLRTDTHNFTKDAVYGTVDYAKCGPKEATGRNLDFFDVVVLYVNGELNLSDAQKKDLLAFVHEDGKGIVGIHTATSAGYHWPEYGEMIGGYFDNHPWNISTAKVIVERPDFPGMAAFVADPIVTDEHYVMTPSPYSRDKVDVLARIDTGSVDMKNPDIHRTDNDFPMAWIKNYGKGRVFYSYLGHPDAAWDDPRVVNLYLSAIAWAGRRIDYPVRPHATPK